ELKKQAISGVKWVTVATVINNGLQFLLITILARFLSKSDFGLMALVQIVIEFSSYFIDMGFSNIIIHKQNISNRQLSSLYWLNIVTGIVIFGIIFILSPLLAAFYKSPELKPLLNFVAVTFIIIPIGQQHKTLLQKEMKFDVISKIDIISRTVSIVTAIFLGIKGYGVYSLVTMVIVNSLISSGLFLFAGLKNHKPNFVLSHTDLKGLYSFGMFQLGERTLNYFAGQFDTIIIGKLLGTSALGVYTIAKNLVMKPQQIVNPIVTRVAFPMMAKVQDNLPLLRKTYISTNNYLCSINFPLHLGIFILAEPLTLLLFGKSWTAAIILVKILSIFAMLRSVYNPIGSLLLAKGRADLGFYWVVAFTIITPPTILAGGLFGLTGVCYAQVILMLITVYPFYFFLIRNLIGARFMEFEISVILPLIIAIAASLVPFLIEPYLHNYFLKIIAVSLSGIIIYVALSLKFNKDFLNILKTLV
ncbi:MAG: MOP flippase family protein, partial [Methanococcaceae archaeon]